MGKKILVADDSLTIQKVVKLALASEPYEIRNVSNGDEASEQLARFRPQILIVDASIPGKSIFELKEELIENGQAETTRILVLSSAFEQIDESKIQDAFDARLTKPFDPSQLRDTVRKLVSSSTSEKNIEKKVAPIKSRSIEEFDISASDLNEVAEKTIVRKSSRHLQRTEAANRSSIKNELDEWRIASHGGLTDDSLEQDYESNYDADQDDEFGFDSDYLEEFGDDDHSSVGEEIHEDVTPITRSQMEDILKSQFEATLATAVKEILPEIAEKIIREELNKMLTQPNSLRT